MMSRVEPKAEFDGRCAFAVSLGKPEVEGSHKWSVIQGGKRYLFSNPIAKILWTIAPGRRKKAEERWSTRRDPD